MKYIIIIGATSGIGLRIAEIYATAGWRVGVAGRRDNVMVELSHRFPDNVVWSHIDVTEQDAGDSLLQLIKKTGGMDVFLNVAGIGFENGQLDIQHDIDTIRTNVEGFTRMVNTAFRYFRDSTAGKGHIACITSISGTKGIDELASYSSSKRYQWSYLQALAQLADKQKLDICFTDIRPGWVRTPLLDPERTYPMTMDVDRVAALAVNAIMHRRKVVVIDWRWRIVYSLWRLVPNRLWTKFPLKISSPKDIH